MAEESQTITNYFDSIQKDIDSCYLVANDARKKGYDPEDRVDIPLARGISERVEGLISAVAIQILKSGVAERIVELEHQYGSLDWRVSLKIAAEVASQKFCKFKDEKEAMEVGIRVGLAYATLGVIAAPLEGFIELKIRNTNDGKKYFSLFFAGPIRAAGGTAAAQTLVIADYVRVAMGYSKFDPSAQEIKRFVSEIQDYHERITNLQYFPSEEEIIFLAEHLAVQVDGDPTEKLDVSNYKDLPRVETNKIRGGMCLVLAEGLAQKAAKIQRQVGKWGNEFNLEWDWLKEFLDIQKQVKAKKTISKDKKDDKDAPKILPNYTYIKDLVAGRPVLSYPLRNGGFRLRYGRTRTTGFASDAIHPATMVALENYVAIGTQLKMERPRKATAINVCDSIEGPVVKLKDGSVLKLDTMNEAKRVSDQIDLILSLGDILINFGEFSEQNHPLVPAGYCPEWWILELEKSVKLKYEKLDIEKISELTNINIDYLEKLFKHPINTKIKAVHAFNLSKQFDIPLHPDYTYFWNNTKKEDLLELLQKQVTITKSDKGFVDKIVIPKNEKIKNLLEQAWVPHLYINNEFIVIEKNHAYTMDGLLNMQTPKSEEEIKTLSELKGSLDIVTQLSGLKIRDKGGTFIGTRMGRPEKAKMRKLLGSPHALFPVGDEGGRLRSFQAAMEEGKITAEAPLCRCNKCNTTTILSRCEVCNEKTQKLWNCRVCKIQDHECEKLDQNGEKHKSLPYMTQEIDVKKYFDIFIKRIKMKNYPELIKGVRGASNKSREPEHLIKGILRAKHNIYVNKDGTTRYDMIEVPITHFKPLEIEVSVEKLIQIGYTVDMYGTPLTDNNQILELKPQDIIMPDCPDSPDEKASEVLINTANFIDDLLVNLYGEKPFYNFTKKEDIVGHLAIGLAPHTSAGTVARIIGFSKTQGMFCHPLFHAAMRRNCDGDEACTLLLMDALLNFSRTFLPDRRGSRTMDAPLVLTSKLVPSEVDSEVHDLDITDKYPLELYENGLEYKPHSSIKIPQLKEFLGTEKQYEGMRYTHETTDMNEAVLCSAYKTLPSMQEKLHGQMSLARKIVAVDERDVAKLVIEKHFLKDIRGNLRKFSQQQFRCVKCNEKFRRPPLVGFCTKCNGGKIIFTISEGSIIKYLEPSLSIAKTYDVPVYLKQSLDMLKRRVEDVFGKEKEKQTGLGSWFG